MKMTDDVLCVDSQWCGDWPHDVDMLREEEEKEKSVWAELTKRTKKFLTELLCRVDDHSSVHVHIYPQFSSYKLCYVLFYYLVFIYSACDVRVNCAPVAKKFSSETYLLKFGYLPQSNIEIRDRVSESTMVAAIRDFQRFGNINVTGVIDEDTRRLMVKPRCGVPDRLSGQFNSRRSRHRMKRYTVQGQKWDVTDITWSLRTRSADSRISESQIIHELTNAFHIWSGSSRLTFHQLSHHDADKADIQIIFARGQHSDAYPFDGKGSILAHAFFPGSGQGGDVHFDDEEIWQVDARDRESKGTRLFAVAAHEFGHSLGLSHSDVEGSLMFPWYQTFDENTPLPLDDKRGIEAIYGWKKTPKGVKPPVYIPPVKVVPDPKPPDRDQPTIYPTHEDKYGRPKTCDSSYDAISLIRQDLFIFKGRYFWRFSNNELNKNKVEQSENILPSETHIFWHGLPKNLTHVDAVYERGELVVFFIDKNYWIFNANHKIAGPIPLTRMKISETIDRIDGAMTWGHNDKTYLFSGSQYWRLDDSNLHNFVVEPDYPRDMYVWKGVPYNIDSVLKWTDNHVYFFKGKVYWKFDDRHMQVASEVPSLSAPFWMGCTSEPIPRQNPRSDGTSTSSSSRTALQLPFLYSSTIFLFGALRLYFNFVNNYYC